MASREYWMVRFRYPNGPEKHELCETREQAERLVCDLKSRGCEAYYWLL